MPVRVTQLPVEVARSRDGTGENRISQLFIEVLVPFEEAGNNYNVSATVPLILAVGQAAQRHAWVAGAAATATFGATARCVRDWEADASVALTLSAEASQDLGVWRPGDATAGLVLDAAADAEVAHREIAASATVPLVLGTYFPRNTIPPQVVGGEDYMGRFQVGADLPLWVATVDHEGAPFLPTAEPPTASVFDVDAGSLVEVAEVPRDRDAAGVPVFAGPLRLGEKYAPGRYAVVYRWGVGGFAGLRSATFEVDEGGDREGAVGSGRALGNARAEHSVAQLGAGRLVAGRDPYPEESL